MSSIKELPDDFCIPVNKYQTEITKELLDALPEEIAQQLLEYIREVDYIKWLVSPDRPRAKDLPKDKEGKIIVDISQPHILEDMDYFRPSALHYQEHGCYTFLRVNTNPNSEYSKWFHEEKRRCREGYVRESDGEWVTGYMYFFINYCPMMVTKINKGSRMANRVQGFAEVWEGLYLRFHYLDQARKAGKHAIELARRGCGKSFSLASIMAHNFLLGENQEVRTKTTTILTAYQKEYLAAKDGTLSKFTPMIDFVEENMEFSKRRLSSSLQNMFWQSGYIDSNGRSKGQLNTVMGVSSKDDEGKLRGKRGYILFEEMGSFSNLLSIYDTVRYGVEEGDYTFGLIYLVGTSAEDASDFESAKTLLYNPEGYNIYAIKNVYDKPNQGKPTFGYFFPAFINRKGCYNEEGVSDVVKALIQILTNRYKAKYSANPNSVIRVIAEMPITPAEAIIKVRDSYFPTVALNERLAQLDADPHAYDDVYIGNLYQNRKTGRVEYVISDDVPIRKFGVDNSTKGALEIFEMPEKDSEGNIYNNRYIMGLDPVDNDQANSSSLMSVFVLDLFTDKLVAEYTGRQSFADEGYEIVRLLCLFYNAKCLYESNIKGTFAYFSRMNCTHLLADTPEYLRDKQLVKYSSWGSSAKGVNATAAVNNYANNLIKDWLMKPVQTIVEEGGEQKSITVSNLFFIRNRALIEELIAYSPMINVDRVRALGMVMLYREEYMVLYNGDLKQSKQEVYDSSYLGNDDFFTRNYDEPTQQDIFL